MDPALRNAGCIVAGRWMDLDLLIPTLRRPNPLKRALESVANADRPRRLQPRVTIINNDTDPELPGIEATLASMPFPTRVLHEPRPGKSAALNTGIATSTAAYFGFIDDDEVLAPDWFRVVEDALDAAPADFLGGPVRLFPGTEIPKWIPPGYPAVIGMSDSGPDERAYDADFPGMLKGGNAVISRAILDRVGPYDPDLGPTADDRLFSCEDEDMHLRLLAAGAQGRYLPHLIVYHSVHSERLTKRYYRQWSFWQGASKGVLARHHSTPFPEIAGVPRYAYGEAVRGLLTLVRTAFGAPPHVRMASELPVWNLVGRLYGRHVRRSRQTASPPASAAQSTALGSRVL
jgi:glycosyltransferase involved in cell wall biosynthesis